jgi:hypothetical protein
MQVRLTRDDELLPLSGHTDHGFKSKLRRTNGPSPTSAAIWARGLGIEPKTPSPRVLPQRLQKATARRSRRN